MSDLLKLLDGKKTYVAAALAALAAAYAAWQGEWAEAQRYAVLALGFAGLRHAIRRGEPCPPVPLDTQTPQTPSANGSHP